MEQKHSFKSTFLPINDGQRTILQRYEKILNPQNFSCTFFCFFSEQKSPLSHIFFGQKVSVIFLKRFFGFLWASHFPIEPLPRDAPSGYSWVIIAFPWSPYSYPHRPTMATPILLKEVSVPSYNSDIRPGFTRVSTCVRGVLMDVLCYFFDAL